MHQALRPFLTVELQVASRAFFSSTRYSQLVFTVLTVGVESSGYRMGTRVSLNAIVWVPMIVGHYYEPPTSWTMGGGRGVRRTIKLQ